MAYLQEKQVGVTAAGTDYADTGREHRDILAALKAGDTEGAIEKLRAHFVRGETAVLGGSD